MMSNELQHYGVLGMKWGVRKNPVKTYAKAVKEKEKRERNVSYRKGVLKEVQKVHEGKKKALADQENTVQVKRAKLALDADTLRKANKKLAEDKYDFFGTNASRQKRDEKDLNESTKSYTEAMNKRNQMVLDLDAHVKDVETASYYAERAISRSERWNKAMAKTFADVPQETIDEGNAYIESLKQKKSKR